MVTPSNHLSVNERAFSEEIRVQSVLYHNCNKVQSILFCVRKIEVFLSIGAYVHALFIKMARATIIDGKVVYQRD